MRDNDGRKIDHKSLEILRLRAVDQMLAGARPEDVAAALGLSRATAYGWLASYRKGGRQALLSRSAPGRPTALSTGQLRRLWTMLADSDPRERQLGAALWTGSLIQELIRREFGICVSVVTVRRLLFRMGVPARRPTAQYDLVLRCQGASEYPSIRARAAADGATIYFGDEQRLQPDVRPSEFLTVSLPPATVFAAVTARTGPCFAVYQGPATATSFASFCARLLHDVPGRVYLVMDGRMEYRERSVSAFPISWRTRLRLFYLSAPATLAAPAGIRNADVVTHLHPAAMAGPDPHWPFQLTLLREPA